MLFIFLSLDLNLVCLLLFIDLPTGSPLDVQIGAVQALLSNSTNEVLSKMWSATCVVCSIFIDYIVSKQSIGVFPDCDQGSNGLLSEILCWSLWTHHY